MVMWVFNTLWVRLYMIHQREVGYIEIKQNAYQ